MAGLKQEAIIVSNKKGYPFVTKNEICIPLRRDTDIVLACQKGRTLAAQMELSDNDQVVVVISISEIARNILHYAGQGQIILTSIREDGRQGIKIIAQDDGPGIPDIEQVLQDGYSTGGGLGLGLSGAKRLMDEFEIISEVGRGTTITMKKWR
jgi:serine/threonine-protein kinase RsbT